MVNVPYTNHEIEEVNNFLKEAPISVNEIDFDAMCKLALVMHGYASGHTVMSSGSMDSTLYPKLFNENKSILNKYPAFKTYLMENAIPYAEWCDGRPHQIVGAKLFIRMVEAIGE